jgi:hypothetical protein
MKLIARMVLCIGACALSTSLAHAATCGGTTYYASDTSDFTNALSCAQPGNTIYLHAGSTFTGPFQLPAKTQTNPPQYITIMTDAPVASPTQPYVAGVTLPADGVRVSPSDKPAMPTITVATSASSSASVISTAASASYYQFIGVEITTPVYVYSLVQIGTGSERSASTLPHHIRFDRSYIHGSAANGTRRGIAANGGQGIPSGTSNDLSCSTSCIEDLVFANSYFSDFNDHSADNQAIMSWNGYGPFKIVNNYLEAAGENVMFGGADPSIRNLVPSNITIKNNHFYKPIGWIADSTKWVKNLFELKNASGVWVQNNVFENNWVNQQNGMGILFTPRNQNGGANWSVVQHVTFVGNIINNTPGGFNILGYDDIYNSKQLNDVTIQNNLLLNVGNQAFVISGVTYNTCGTNTAQCGRTMQIENATNGVSFDHNTAFGASGVQTGGGVTYSFEKSNQNFKMTNNVAVHGYCAPGSNYCGMSGDSASPGDPAISKYFTAPVNVSYNVLYNGDEAGTYTYWTTPGVSNNSIPGPAGSPSDPNLSPTGNYTQTMYLGSDGVTPAGIDASVWPIYSTVVQVTSDGGK